MIRWTGLAPCEFEFTFPGTFLVGLEPAGVGVGGPEAQPRARDAQHAPPVRGAPALRRAGGQALLTEAHVAQRVHPHVRPGRHVDEAVPAFLIERRERHLRARGEWRALEQLDRHLAFRVQGLGFRVQGSGCRVVCERERERGGGCREYLPLVPRERRHREHDAPSRLRGEHGRGALGLWFEV